MTISPETYNLRHRKKLGTLFSDLPTDDHDDHHLTYSPRRHSDAAFFNITTDHGDSADASYSNPSSGCSSPNLISSPWTHPSPYTKSPWIHQIVPSSVPDTDEEDDDGNLHDKIGLLGSLFREQGHVYSIASAGGLLYTGSDSKNVRVWKDLEEFSGFKSSSGLVKAIVVFGDRVFTGHQDGKIRVWKYLGENRAHKRVGNLPTTRDLIFKSINPRNYTKSRRRRRVPWVKHYDAVSCLCVDPGLGLLYSGSWDKTLKVWRISDSKCVESIRAHDDAVNAVVVGFDGLVFTASADGAVKAWRRREESTRHLLVETLLRQGSALTSLAVSGGGLYAGSSDGFVSFWEREKKRDFMSYGGVLRGHKLAVLCVAAGGDRLVMSGSADESVCVWRRDGGGGGHTCLAVLTGHTGPVKCLAVEKDISGDDQWIVYTGSLDKSVKLWRVSES